MDNILGVRVLVHPVALFSIVDSYERRQESDKRVIGSLLGVKTQPGVVEIMSGYAVPHNETTDEVGGAWYGCVAWDETCNVIWGVCEGTPLRGWVGQLLRSRAGSVGGASSTSISCPGCSGHGL
jgi:hypothetical protein